MRIFRQLMTGSLLLGLAAGFFGTPLSLAACEKSAQEKSCCCPLSDRKTGCCPVQKSTECPVLKKANAAPVAILPGKINLPHVVLFFSMPKTVIPTVKNVHQAILSEDLPPPGDGFAVSHRLRAPPALA